MKVTAIATFAILLTVIQTAMCNNNSTCCEISPDPTKFFPKVKGNLTEIVWAHAVNNIEKLKKTLESENVMMVEADVIIGNLSKSNETNIPIMGHPPANESDLSLENFLNHIIQKKVKGMKLDFKTDRAFDMSKPILAKYRPNMTFPVILNADIVSGPVNATTVPLDAKNFIIGANNTVPESTLSVGWTTRYGKEFNITEGRYSSKQIQTMIDTLKENRVTQSVTYPVRAGLAVNAVNEIKALLKNTTFTNVTLTIWSSEGDSVNAAKLSQLIKDVGVDKVYLDVPEYLKRELDLAPSVASTLNPTMMSLSALVLLILSKML